MTDGLRIKYHLTKADGRDVDPEGDYFVLKLNSKDEIHASASKLALLAYARYVAHYMPQLAADLQYKIAQHLCAEEIEALYVIRPSEYESIEWALDSLSKTPDLD